MKTDLSILLSDDGARAAFLSWRRARGGGLARLRITAPTSMDHALRLHADGTFDLVLLAVDPTDARGSLALERVREAVGTTPIVLLNCGAATPTEASAPPPGHPASDSPPIARLAPRAPEPLDGWLGQAPMQATLPHVFEDLAGDIANLLHQAKGSASAGTVVLPHVPILAARLAMLTATPADVSELVRAAALRRAHAHCSDGDPHAWAALCARLLVTLLGALCEQYKRDALDDRRSRGTDVPSAGT